MMKVIIKYCETTLKMNAEKVSEFVNYLVVDPSQSSIKEIVNEVDQKKAYEIMRNNSLGEGITFMLQMTRPDLIIQIGFQYLDRLIQASTRNEIINNLKELDQRLSPEDMKQLREVSPNFNFMFEFLYF